MYNNSEIAKSTEVIKLTLVDIIEHLFNAKTTLGTIIYRQSRATERLGFLEPEFTKGSQGDIRPVPSNSLETMLELLDSINYYNEVLFNITTSLENQLLPLVEERSIPGKL